MGTEPRAEVQAAEAEAVKVQFRETAVYSRGEGGACAHGAGMGSREALVVVRPRLLVYGTDRAGHGYGLVAARGHRAASGGAGGAKKTVPRSQSGWPSWSRAWACLRPAAT